MSRPGPNVIYTCKRCGDKYHPNSARQQCCNKPIKVPCAVCGKLMDQICTFARQNEACSKECNNKLIKQRQIESGNRLIKTCKYCGKEFHPNYAREVYCPGPHYNTCEICGKQFEIDPSIDYPKTCSNECRYIAASQNKDIESMKANLKSTMLKKYGVENAMHLPTSIEKLKQTNRTRYGKEFYTQTEEYRNSVKRNALHKYGVEHHLQSHQVIEKRIQTNIEKYGVDNPFKSEEIKEKIKEVTLERYGVEHVSRSPEIHSKISLNRHNIIASDGTVFDSTYELQFYEFLLHIPHVNIQTQIPIEFEYNGKLHTTLIDFKVNNMYFEVKGSHLLEGIFDYGQLIPIEEKLKVYAENNCVIITDKYVDILEEYKLKALDIELFREVVEDYEMQWQRILDAISSQHKFIDQSVINL